MGFCLMRMRERQRDNQEPFLPDPGLPGDWPRPYAQARPRATPAPCRPSLHCVPHMGIYTPGHAWRAQIRAHLASQVWARKVPRVIQKICIMAYWKSKSHHVKNTIHSSTNTRLVVDRLGRQRGVSLGCNAKVTAPTLTQAPCPFSPAMFRRSSHRQRAHGERQPLAVLFGLL